MTTSAFRALTTAEQVFKDLIWSPMIQAGEVWIEGAVPFLALPVIKQLDEATIGAITDALFNQIVLVIDVTAINLVDAAHQSAFDSASERLAIVAQENGITSDQYIAARDKEVVAMVAFTRMSGS